jgi:hypothetical protein
MKADVGRNSPDEGVSYRRFSCWALWWGISFGIAFLTAAAIGFMLSGAPYVDKSGQAEITPHYRSQAFGFVVAAVPGTRAVDAALDLRQASWGERL